jgi:predicted site-specific integrase-resolvase
VRERLDHERVFDTKGAAQELGVARITVQKWVERGHLQPVPGVTPRVFFEGDLVICQSKRRLGTVRRRVADAAARWARVSSDSE